MADGPDLSTAGQMSRHISARIAKSAAMAFLHGIARYSDLLKTGLRRDDIRRLERLGRIGRVRRGWYAAPGSPPEVIRAVRIGGVLSCVSALRYYGVWVPPTNQLHIRRSEHLQAKLPLPANTHLCPVPIRVAPSVAVDPLETALLAATRCLDDEGMVVVLDSILNQRLLTRSQLAVILADCPRRVRRLLAETDAQAQSGTESMVRFRLRRLGIKVRSQVHIEDVGRVDLLVGKRLVIEVDSREHHTSAAAYANDRRRDFRLVTRKGMVVIRLTYDQVMYEWDAVIKELLRLIRSREHLKPRAGQA